MALFVGGNLEQLDQLATTYRREGEQVERLHRAIDAALGQTD